jgi:hypothetical protein
LLFRVSDVSGAGVRYRKRRPAIGGQSAAPAPVVYGRACRAVEATDGRVCLSGRLDAADAILDTEKHAGAFLSISEPTPNFPTRPNLGSRDGSPGYGRAVETVKNRTAW